MPPAAECGRPWQRGCTYSAEQRLITRFTTVAVDRPTRSESVTYRSKTANMQIGHSKSHSYSARLHQPGELVTDDVNTALIIFHDCLCPAVVVPGNCLPAGALLPGHNFAATGRPDWWRRFFWQRRCSGPAVPWFRRARSGAYASSSICSCAILTAPLLRRAAARCPRPTAAMQRATDSTTLVMARPSAPVRVRSNV